MFGFNNQSNFFSTIAKKDIPQFKIAISQLDDMQLKKLQGQIINDAFHKSVPTEAVADAAEARVALIYALRAERDEKALVERLTTPMDTRYVRK